MADLRQYLRQLNPEFFLEEDEANGQPMEERGNKRRDSPTSGNDQSPPPKKFRISAANLALLEQAFNTYFTDTPEECRYARVGRQICQS